MLHRLMLVLVLLMASTVADAEPSTSPSPFNQAPLGIRWDHVPRLNCPTCQLPDAFKGPMVPLPSQQEKTFHEDQAPEHHPPETVTIPKSVWDQMMADREEAARRIIELKKQVADLQEQLKKKQGAGG
jgi:hypothetical protein